MRNDCTTTEVIDLLETRDTGRLKTYADGETLFHQGCPVERIYVIREGMVKAYSTSPDGKAQTYGIYKEGRILGVTAHLVWGKHKLTTEALGNVQVRLVHLSEFDRLLENDLEFSLAIIKELARIIDRLEDRISSLSFLDVRERLRHSLGLLALEYGAEMDAGVKIDLDLTHEEIAELIVADRSTVTSYLTELRRQGYLWRDGHRLVMVPPEHITVLENLRQSISMSDELVIGQWVARAIELKVEPARVLDALTEGLRLAETRFQKGDCGVPDVAVAVALVNEVLAAANRAWARRDIGESQSGTVAIGTAAGEEHVLGKRMVVIALATAGYQVIDLGSLDSSEKYVEAVRTLSPDVLALSVSTPAFIPQVEQMLQALTAAGLRDQVKVLVGGSSMTEAIATQIGADLFGLSARDAVKLTEKLLAIG